MPRRRPRPAADLPDQRPALIEGQQARFTARPNQAGFYRWYAGNYHAGAAWRCEQAGDLEGAAHHWALNKAAREGTLRLRGDGPPVPIASRRPAPPWSPEEP